VKSPVSFERTWRQREGTGRDPKNEALNFIEHCILVAGGSPQANDGEYVQLGLRLVAEGFWPDLLNRPYIQLNMETGELEIETANAIVYVRVRGVVR
jgi:hypothetical protein